MLHLSESTKIVEALKPQAGAALTADYVSLKNVGMAYVLVHINQANAATVAITIEQASAVAGTGSKPITISQPIWVNQDCASSDTLVRQNDGVGFTTSAAIAQKLVVFQIDPATLDQANGFNCITVKTGASHADNITSALYVLADYRQQPAIEISAIVD